MFSVSRSAMYFPECTPTTASSRALELPQLREDVKAVDSAVRPEVEQQDLSADVGEGERASAGIDPVEPRRKIGGADDGE
jgi:hypothetical protein